MTHSDLCDALRTSGIPWTAERWECPAQDIPALPYIILRRADADESYADNANVADVDSWDVELYSHNYDYAAESRLTAHLKARGFAYARTVAGEIPNSGGVCQLVIRTSTMN